MPEPPWHQHTVQLEDTDRTRAELAELLNSAQTAGDLSTWSYIRKGEDWRLRYRAEPDGVDALEQRLIRAPHVTHQRTIYEPEIAAFGGPEGMDVAHVLAHHDSRHLLAGNRPEGLGPREISVLLFSTMLRGARLDWYEQGDAWAKVVALRPEPLALASQETARLKAAVRRLMTVDAASLSRPFSPAWLGAWAEAGQCLAALARSGRLQRGLRAVLAHHFIFHANRAGLSGPDQATLAALAAAVVFDSPDQPSPGSTDTKVPTMTLTQSDSAETLRNQLVDSLAAAGTIRTPAIEHAMRAVPRHVFLPGVDLADAYADSPVYTKAGGGGEAISAASQPGIVAMMLEQLGVQPGDRVLEIGAGTGYNAALLAHLAGADGHVTSVDLDLDLVEEAGFNLTAAGVHTVQCVDADGALGHPANAPYDRLVATVGAWEVPLTWLEQTAVGGRIVVPLRLAGAASRSIIFERRGDGWHSVGSEQAVFMPLRGIGDDARRIIDLTGDAAVTLQAHADNGDGTDPHALAGVLKRPAHETWTGVHFVPRESFELLDLWLCCHLTNPLMRLNAEQTATDSGLVRPMFGRTAMATTSTDGTLAYLAIRQAPPAPDAERRFEVGIISHGPSAQLLADEVAAQITAWDNHARGASVHFTLPQTAPSVSGPMRVVLDRPQQPITVTWQ